MLLGEAWKRIEFEASRNNELLQILGHLAILGFLFHRHRKSTSSRLLFFSIVGYFGMKTYYRDDDVSTLARTLETTEKIDYCISFLSAFEYVFVSIILLYGFVAGWEIPEDKQREELPTHMQDAAPYSPEAIVSPKENALTRVSKFFHVRRRWVIPVLQALSGALFFAWRVRDTESDWLYGTLKTLATTAFWVVAVVYPAMIVLLAALVCVLYRQGALKKGNEEEEAGGESAEVAVGAKQSLVGDAKAEGEKPEVTVMEKQGIFSESEPMLKA